MPGLLDETEAILRFVADELGPDTYVNVMAQYYPRDVPASCPRSIGTSTVPSSRARSSSPPSSACGWLDARSRSAIRRLAA
jgi:hypothetical protein